MWIQNAAHSVLWICINIVFFHVQVILNVKKVLLLSAGEMYLDAHVKPPPLFDVNKQHWVKNQKTTLFTCPWFL